MPTPIDNQISISFTEQELKEVDDAMGVLEKFAQKLITLSPKQSQMYGKLGDENDGFTNMIHEDASTDTALLPAFIDTREWAADEDARKALQPRATRLKGISRRFTDTARLLGFDIYNTALSVYNNVKFLASRNQGNAVTYYNKWKGHFPGGRKGDGGGDKD